MSGATTTRAAVEVGPEDLRWADRAAAAESRVEPWRRHRDDLAAEAALALATAAARFDPGRPASFRTFAHPHVRGALLRAKVRLLWAGLSGHPWRGEASWRPPRAVPLDAPAAGGTTMAEELEARPDREWPWPASPEAVGAAVESLPSPHRVVIAQLYGMRGQHAHSPEAAARARNWTAERLRAVHAEALAMLRERLLAGPGIADPRDDDEQEDAA